MNFWETTQKNNCDVYTAIKVFVVLNRNVADCNILARVIRYKIHSINMEYVTYVRTYHSIADSTIFSPSHGVSFYMQALHQQQSSMEEYNMARKQQQRKKNMNQTLIRCWTFHGNRCRF